MANAANYTADATSSFESWLKTPYTSTMSAGGWFLFIGLLVAISVAWGIILKDLQGEL